MAFRAVSLRPALSSRVWTTVPRAAKPYPNAPARCFHTHNKLAEQAQDDDKVVVRLRNEKWSTGLACVPVVPHAREVLIKIYERILEEYKQFEEDNPYRVYMSKVLKYRLKLCYETEDIFELERKLSLGQLEELIIEAEGEFKMIPFVLEHRLWEKPDKWHSPFALWSAVK